MMNDNSWGMGGSTGMWLIVIVVILLVVFLWRGSRRK